MVPTEDYNFRLYILFAATLQSEAGFPIWFLRLHPVDRIFRLDVRDPFDDTAPPAPFPVWSGHIVDTVH
eukprot:154442-Pyramimonas_sp.AAC.2